MSDIPAPASDGPASAPARGTAAPFAALLLAVLSFSLMRTMAVPVLPQPQREFGACTTSVSWVLSLFLLTASVATALLGRVGDMFGNRRVLVAGLAVFAVGVLPAALSSGGHHRRSTARRPGHGAGGPGVRVRRRRDAVRDVAAASDRPADRALPDDERAAADGGAGATARREVTDGLRHIRHDRVPAALIIVLAIGELGFAGPLNIGVTLPADERGWGAAGLGWIVGGFGAGAAGSSLPLAVRGRLPRAGLVQQIRMTLGAAATGALTFAPSLPATVAVGAAVGLTAGLSEALAASLLQTTAAPAYLGRVTAVSGLFSLGLAPLTYPLGGLAAATWGTRPVFVAGAAMVAAGSLTGLCSRSLRRAELPH
ncbi:MFS transporter [Streptomyces sp. NPDC001770]